MKKFILGSLLSVLSLSAVTPKANAGIIIGALDLNQVQHQSDAVVLFEGILCLSFLPLCILDEDKAGAVNKKDLLENGFSEPEVDHLMAEQNRLSQTLRRQGKRIIVDRNSKEGNTAEVLRSLDPKISTEYVQFFSQVNGVN